MATLIKNTTTQGLYLLENTGADWVGSDTPGDCDLSLLVIGQTYIYFNSILSLQKQQTHNYESDTQRGWRTQPSGEGTMKWFTGGSDKELYAITVEDTLANAQYAEGLAKYRNRTTRDATKIYLVRQTASNTFRKFPDENSSYKNYCPVLLRGVTSIESANTDRQTISLVLEAIWT